LPLSQGDERWRQGKIKLRSAGYRLVYVVRQTELIVIVVAVGKRERNAVYKAAAGR
jgi:mRNA interferase RelE/StbE